MAIQTNFESIYGASFKESYHKILSVVFDYVENTKTTRIGIYCDKLSRDIGKPPIYIRKVVTAVDEKEYPIRETNYTELKETPNYSECKDI
jgi:hypothetical protein